MVACGEMVMRGQIASMPFLGTIYRAPTGLLDAELDGDGEVHGSRAAVELRGRILPLLHGFESGLMKHGRAGEHFHGGDITLGIDQGVEGDVAGNVLRARHRRIDRGNGFDQAGLLDVSANGGRSGGFFTVAASQAGK